MLLSKKPLTQTRQVPEMEILATFVNHVRQAVTLPKSDVIFRLLTEVNQSQRPLKPRMTVLTNAES